MRNRQLAIAIVVIVFAILLSLGCIVTEGGLGLFSTPPPTDTPTATNTPIPRPPIDFNATVLAATVQAGGSYIVTSTPLPVWPTSTLVPFDEVSFLATINAQFAQATETALALATPTPTPTRTPPPPRILPVAGGSAPDRPSP